MEDLKSMTPEELTSFAKEKDSGELERFASGLRNAEVERFDARFLEPTERWPVRLAVSLAGDEDTLAMQLAALVNVLQIGDGYEAWLQLAEACKTPEDSATVSLGVQYEFKLSGLGSPAGKLDLTLQF
jgi:hypothetical protein